MRGEEKKVVATMKEEEEVQHNVSKIGSCGAKEKLN